MDKKTVSISQKRQITIPAKFFELLGFGTEAECILRGNELIIRPKKQDYSGEFATQILADLISQGFEGDALLEEFKKQQANINKAVENMLDEAKSVSKGEGSFATYDEVFNSED